MDYLPFDNHTFDQTFPIDFDGQFSGSKCICDKTFTIKIDGQT